MVASFANWISDGLRFGLGMVAPIRLESIGPNVSGNNGYTWLHIYKQNDNIIISYVEDNVTKKTEFSAGIIINGRIINNIIFTPEGKYGNMKVEVDYGFSDELREIAANEQLLMGLCSNS